MLPLRSAPWLWLVLLFAGTWPAFGGSVEIREGASPGRVSVDARDASPVDILAKLGQKYGFTVESSGGKGQPMTGKLEGKPEDLITRLLRHEGHVVHRSAGKPLGVSRIILLGKSGPTTKTGRPPGRIAPSPTAEDEDIVEEEPEPEDPDIPPNQGSGRLRPPRR